MEKETDLIEELKNHSEVAFDLVFDKYHKLVYHVIYFIVKNRETTEELVQDTFIRMYNNIHTLINNHYFKGWLLKIAKNIAYDEVKKRKVSVVYDEEIVGDTLSYDANKDIKIDFKKVLDDLEYSIIVLILIHGLKRREVASILNKPLTTIQREYQKGLKKLKILYGDDNEKI